MAFLIFPHFTVILLPLVYADGAGAANFFAANTLPLGIEHTIIITAKKAAKLFFKFFIKISPILCIIVILINTILAENSKIVKKLLYFYEPDF